LYRHIPADTGVKTYSADTAKWITSLQDVWKTVLGKQKRIITLIKLYECLQNARSADKTQANERNAKIDIVIHFGLSGVYLLFF